LKEKNLIVAEENFLGALRINEKKFGEKHISVAESKIALARLYKDKGNKEFANKYYAEAMLIYQGIFKFEHPKRVQIKSELKMLNI
jgi:hypothetical protein